MRGRGLLAEVVEQVEDVGVDIVRVASVDEHVSAPRHGVQRLLQRCPVQEAHLVGELDAQDLARGVSLHHTPQRAAQIAVEDEAHGDHEPDGNALEQIRRHDG